MSFSTRLWLGYLFFVGLILFMSITVIISFRELGSAIDIIMRENYASSEAASSMIGALSVIDKAMLALILGQEEMHEQTLQGARDQFDSSFRIAWSNITIPGEERVLSKVDHYYHSLLEKEEELLKQHEERVQYYQTSVLPVQAELKRLLVDIINLNQQAMVQADIRAKNLASSGVAWVLIITVVGMLMAMAMGRSMTRSLIAPLKTLTTVTHTIADGDLSRRISLPGKGKDEIGTLSKSINYLADFIEKYRLTEQARILTARQLVQALLNNCPSPALIVDGNASIVSMNHHAEPCFAGQSGVDFRNKLLERLMNFGDMKNIGDETETVRDAGVIEHNDGKSYHVKTRLLISDQNHSIGRIVYLEHA